MTLAIALLILWIAANVAFAWVLHRRGSER